MDAHFADLEARRRVHRDELERADRQRKEALRAQEEAMAKARADAAKDALLKASAEAHVLATITANALAGAAMAAADAAAVALSHARTADAVAQTAMAHEHLQMRRRALEVRPWGASCDGLGGAFCSCRSMPSTLSTVAVPWKGRTCWSHSLVAHSHTRCSF